METAPCLKNRLPLPRWFFVFTALLFLGLNGTEQDVFRNDVLTFHGKESITADSLTSDSFPVTLVSKAATPSEYSIILRRIDPVEKALFLDAQNGRWHRFDLFRAALIAEGIRDPKLIDTYEARLDALVAKVLAAAQATGSTNQQTLTRSLFEAMHKEILTGGYSLHCTELSKVMGTGSFNCVSATILFNVLAEKAGLDVSGLEMPGHALSRVRFADGVTVSIETTAPTWFDMQTDRERQLATLQRIAPTPAIPDPVTARNAAAPPEVVAEAELLSKHREINSVQLVATIYYNRGVDLHAKKRFPEAAAANLKALYLDKDNTQAWTNLLASLNNWALHLAQEGRRYDDAAVILDQGVTLDSTYANFRTNQTYVFHRWISGLAGLGHFDAARVVYGHAEQRIPGDGNLQKLIDEVNQTEANILRQRR